MGFQVVFLFMSWLFLMLALIPELLALIPELKGVDDLGECLGIFLGLVDYRLPHVIP